MRARRTDLLPRRPAKRVRASFAGVRYPDQASRLEPVTSQRLSSGLLALAAAVIVAGCGDSGEGDRIPASDANELIAELETLQTEVQESNCIEADQQLNDISERASDLGDEVDPSITRGLERLVRQLDDLVRQECPPEETTTSSTTIPEATTTTGPPPTEETESTEESTTSKETTTKDTTSSTSTPAPKPPQPAPDPGDGGIGPGGAGPPGQRKSAEEPKKQRKSGKAGKPSGGAEPGERQKKESER